MHFSKVRQNSTYIQETLLKYAANNNDYDIAYEQLLKLPLNPSVIVHKILILYQQSNKRLVVSTALEHKTELLSAMPNNLDIALAIAAECADDLILSKERDELLYTLELLPNGRAMLAIHRLMSTIKNNILSVPEAIDELWKVYEEGEIDKQVLAQLFDHLDITDSVQASKAIRVAKNISEQRQFTEREATRLCQAWSTVSGWTEIVSITTEALLRFDESIRLKAIKALALDELGHTPEALEILEQVIHTNKFDPYAFELYAQIASRCGLTNKSLNLFERLLEHSDEKIKKANILRIMFLLETSLDTESNRLLDICSRYGEVNNKDDEIEEGGFLQMFFAATISDKVTPSSEQLSNFHSRLAEFQRKFPKSGFMRAVSFNNDSPEEFLELLKEISGMTEEKRRWYLRHENLLRAGLLPIPFCLRPKVILNVTDLLYLWELAKNVGKDDRQYHLMMSTKTYIPKENTNYLDSRIIIDNISILVLYDLGILEYFLETIPRIAIAKSTLIQYQKWSHNLFVSPLCDKAKKIVALLARFTRKIEQPSAIQIEENQGQLDTLDDQKNIMRTSDNIFYSDDAIARLYVCDTEDESRCITTIDIIELLVQLGRITRFDASIKYSELCRWNVIGVPVRFVDVLRVLEPYMESGLSISMAVERLEHNLNFSYFIDAIWDLRKDYTIIVREFAQFLSIVFLEADGIHVDDSIIAALWYWWYRKVQFKKDGEEDKLDYLARSCLAIALNLSNQNIPQSSKRKVSHRLWSNYKSTVQFIYGEMMDENIDRKLFKRLAEFTAKDNRISSNQVFQFLKDGLEQGPQIVICSA
ncbi:MAG: hypothetical protein IPK65_08400 [Gammaproteobacteria bacterium]|nr:hypothetical protein [Gammaproteobacteria bacterium]